MSLYITDNHFLSFVTVTIDHLPSADSPRRFRPTGGMGREIPRKASACTRASTRFVKLAQIELLAAQAQSPAAYRASADAERAPE